MSTLPTIPHLINGQAVDGRDCFETLNPANQDVLAEVAAGGGGGRIGSSKDSTPSNGEDELNRFMMLALATALGRVPCLFSLQRGPLIYNVFIGSREEGHCG